jgi:hypothetical protein
VPILFLPSLRHESQQGGGGGGPAQWPSLKGIAGPAGPSVCVCPVDLISVCALYVVLPKETIMSEEDLVFFAVVIVCFIHHPVLDNVGKASIWTHREMKNKERGKGGKPLSLYEGNMETGAN